ncbi:hypothetical protein SGPA1_31359 [Streptomyces misionensis JCM 4497]
MAGAGAGPGPAPGGFGADRCRAGAGAAAALGERGGGPAGRAGARADHRAERVQDPDRLPGSGAAGARGEAPGDVRAGADAVGGGRPAAGASALPRGPAGRGDGRSGVVLAGRLPGRTGGAARSLSEAPVAAGPGGCRAHPAHQRAARTLTGDRRRWWFGEVRPGGRAERC